MKRLMFLLLSGLLTGLLSMAVSADDMAPYAIAEQGDLRLVIRLPPVENEADDKVELRVGKPILIDCNRTIIEGRVEKLTTEDQAHPYYRAVITHSETTNLISCPPNSNNREEYVYASGEGFTLEYQQEQPIVIYVPEDYEVRYRILGAHGHHRNKIYHALEE
jgi:ecotin